MQELIIVTGMSGSGKTIALRSLEDMDYYCVDNLPVEMLEKFVEHIADDAEFYPRVSVGIDIRNSGDALRKLPEILKQLDPAKVNPTVLFLTANNRVLLKRFSETRRRHPLSNRELKYSLTQAIDAERELLEPLAASADLLLDTSESNVHQLRQQLVQQLSKQNPQVSILVKSFAFKRGVPFDADFVFDARCLPNPYWVPELRQYSGRDEPIRQYLGTQPMVREYLNDMHDWLEKWIPRFEENDRSYLTVAIGCTGGHHRSVFLAEQLAKHLGAQRDNVLVQHRELD
jgi:UPF0042 nucleotide-binding protein